jgi:hypothetical protein
MLCTRTIRPLLVATGDGDAHLSAASGLVRIGRRLYVAADDENMLGVFDLEEHRPGTLRRLFEGDLPAAHEARKATKADLESLTVLPPFPGHPTGALLALGSGSRPQRQRAALMSLDREGALDGVVRQIDLWPLYAPLREQHPLLNIEGAFVNVGHLCLLQRGHAAEPVNAVIRFDWDATQAWLRGASIPDADRLGQLFACGHADSPLLRHLAPPPDHPAGSNLHEATGHQR